MKRFSDKKLERSENKKKKIKTFIDFINNTNGFDNSSIGLKNGFTVDENKDILTADDSKDVFTSNFKEMSELRKRLSIRLSTERPKIFVENEYLIKDSNELSVKCLTIEDIQQFVLATLLPPPRLSCPPNWCKVLKSTKAEKVCVFVIDFDLNETKEVFNENDFKYCVKFEAKEDWINSLLNVRLSNRQLDKMHKKSKSKANTTEIEITEEERVSRTKLLLSLTQLSIEKYPLTADKTFSHFAKTKPKYSPVGHQSPIYAVDCEMCLTVADRHEVTRISVVDENCSVIYDTLVKPKNQIKNYLTKYSGITKKMLDPIDVTLEDVHKQLHQILPEDAILCGQSLNFDLQALQLIHPYVIDTSVIYNLSGMRAVKPSLKQLSQRFLNISIQNNGNSGHDSVEDAIASMKLVKLKMSMGLDFGDRVLNRSVTYAMNREWMSLNSFLERHETELKVFYDYVDIESNDKILVIYSTFDKRNNVLSEAINRVILSDKQIAVIIDKRGKCYIKY